MSCEYCRRYPHHPSCPLAPDPPMFAECVMCGYEILYGEEYYDIDGDCYCEECISSCHKTAEGEDV